MSLDFFIRSILLGHIKIGPSVEPFSVPPLLGACLFLGIWALHVCSLQKIRQHFHSVMSLRGDTRVLKEFFILSEVSLRNIILGKYIVKIVIQSFALPLQTPGFSLQQFADSGSSI